MFNLDSALGIDIRDGGLGLAAVQKGLQGFTLKNRLWVDRYQELPRAELVGRLQQFVRGNGFNRENIVVGLSREKVVIREVDLPLEVEENLPQVVGAQVGRYEPSEDEPSFHDFRVVSRNEASRRLQIQVVMTRRREVEDLLELLTEAGLYPAAVRHSGIALHAALELREEAADRKKPTLVLWVGSGRAEAVLVAGNRYCISEGFNLPESFTPEQLLDATGEALAAHEDRIGDISRLYLAGPLAAEVLDGVRRQVNGAVLLREGLALKRPAMPDSELEQFLPALGLAVSGLGKSSAAFNLIPEEKRLVGGRPSLIPTVVLGLLLALILTALLTHSALQQRQLAGRIQKQVAALQSEVDAAFTLREEMTRKEEEVKTLRSLLRGRQNALNVLKDITERFPDDAYLQNLQVQGGQVSMQGYADHASTLLPLLVESPYLEGVKTNWITQDPRMGGKERFNFAAVVKGK